MTLKRARESDMFTNAKRFQIEEIRPSNQYVNIYSVEKNLERLNLQFEEINETIIHETLIQSENNLEKASNILKSYKSQLTAQQKYSQQLYDNLVSVDTIEKACAITMQTLQHFTREISESYSIKEKELDQNLDRLQQENLILKKGIRGLMSQSISTQQFEQAYTENQQLKDEAQKLKMEIYNLKMQIQLRGSLKFERPAVC